MTSKSPATGITDILKGVSGLLTGWTPITGQVIPEPDQLVVVNHSGGMGGEVTIAIDYPSIQVLVRGGRGASGYEDAWQMARAIREALIAIPTVTPPTAYPELTSCVALGEIMQLGYDDAKRPMFSVNFRLIVSYATSGYRIL